MEEEGEAEGEVGWGQVHPAPQGARILVRVVLSWAEMAGLLYPYSHQSLDVGPSGNDCDIGLSSPLQLKHPSMSGTPDI